MLAEGFPALLMLRRGRGCIPESSRVCDKDDLISQEKDAKDDRQAGSWRSIQHLWRPSIVLNV
eukprot:5855958-Amphidinium_carterae.1